MKFEEIQHFELCKLLFCVKEKLLPTPIINMFHLQGGKTHHYNTRYKSLPNIKKHSSTEYNKFFMQRDNLLQPTERRNRKCKG